MIFLSKVNAFKFKKCMCHNFCYYYSNVLWYLSIFIWSEWLIEVFGFSVLCGSRVSQMTKTYNDIDAVTRLLEEVSRKN